MQRTGAAALHDDPLAVFTVLCLRGRWDAAALDAARRLASERGIDWTAWRAGVDLEGLAPLLYRILRGQGVVPADVEAGLQAAYHTSLRRSALAFRDLGLLLRELSAAGVPVILLKGAALAGMVYRNVALRPMSDLDLLVRRDQIGPALACLARLGYQPQMAEAHAGAALAYENEILLRKPGVSAMLVEVHWSLLDAPYYQHKLPMAWFWDSAVAATVEGVQTSVLGPEALLLHLCAHLTLHHRGMGLLWQHDIAETLRCYREKLDWSLLAAKASAYDLVLPVRRVLPQVASAWAAPIPEGVLEALARLKASPAEEKVFGRQTASRRPVVHRLYADLAGMPDWPSRLRYAVASMLPAPDYMRRRYRIRHSFLLPLYYPYRWLLGLAGALGVFSRQSQRS